LFGLQDWRPYNLCTS